MVKGVCSISLLMILVSAMQISLANERRVLTSDEVTHGGFLLPELKITEINNQSETLFGLKGAWLVDHSFYLGMAGYGSGYKIKNTDKYMAYGGILIGYIFNPNHLVSISTDLLIGAGAFAEDNDDIDEDDGNRYFSRNRNRHHYSDKRNREADLFSVYEPSINILLNVTESMRLSLGASYRYLQKTNFDTLRDEDVSGGTVSLGIMFGFL